MELSCDESPADAHNVLLPPETMHLPSGRATSHNVYRDAAPIPGSCCRVGAQSDGPHRGVGLGGAHGTVGEVLSWLPAARTGDLPLLEADTPIQSVGSLARRLNPRIRKD